MSFGFRGLIVYCQNCSFVRSVACDGKGVMKMGSEVCHYGESIDNRDDASLTPLSLTDTLL